jgi:hypothetical protein
VEFKEFQEDFQCLFLENQSIFSQEDEALNEIAPGILK